MEVQRADIQVNCSCRANTFRRRLDQAPGVHDDAVGSNRNRPTCSTALGRCEQSTTRPGSRNAHEVGSRTRIGQRQQDVRRRARSAQAFAAAGDVLLATVERQRWTRYGLAASKARAWRSTRLSASSVDMLSASVIRLATRPK